MVMKRFRRKKGDGDWLVVDLDQINLRAMVLLQQM